MTLVVFDFDHTIIDANSDIEINKLFPSKETLAKALQQVNGYKSWTTRMQSMFELLKFHEITEDDYRKVMTEIPLTDGFVSLIQYLHALPNTELIIASDSNQVFIEMILKHHNLIEKFKRIFTNPAHFDTDQQYLQIQPLGQETCPSCPSNMCKREIIENYRKTLQIDDLKVLFIGDGHNDVCAAKSLKKCDLVCARGGYRMADELSKWCNDEKNQLQTTLFEWTNGDEIKKFVHEKWL